MSAPVNMRGNFTDFYGSAALPALEERFKHDLAQLPQMRERLAKVVRTTNDIWQATESTDLQNFIEVPEGTDYTFVRNRQGASKTLTPKKYGLGFTISEEMVEDGKFDHISELVSALARSANDSREQSVFDLINGAFGTTDAWDGLDLCHTAHTLPSGLTFRNRLSTDADLSASSLDTMISDYETQFISDSGKYLMLKPKVLLVHSSQRRYANELIGSDLKADTSDNNKNMLKEEGLIVMSSPRITDTDSWMLLGAPSETGLRIIERKGIETKAAGPDTGFVNDSIMYKSRYREIVGATHPYAIFGTTGG